MGRILSSRKEFFHYLSTFIFRLFKGTITESRFRCSLQVGHVLPRLFSQRFCLYKRLLGLYAISENHVNIIHRCPMGLGGTLCPQL